MSALLDQLYGALHNATQGRIIYIQDPQTGAYRYARHMDTGQVWELPQPMPGPVPQPSQGLAAAIQGTPTWPGGPIYSPMMATSYDTPGQYREALLQQKVLNDMGRNRLLMERSDREQERALQFLQQVHMGGYEEGMPDLHQGIMDALGLGWQPRRDPYARGGALDPQQSLDDPLQPYEQAAQHAAQTGQPSDADYGMASMALRNAFKGQSGFSGIPDAAWDRLADSLLQNPARQ